MSDCLPTSPILASHDQCTGCGACANGCPKRAIHMLPDREGFLYPTVTDACVACGHCSHICPVLKQREKRSDPAVFAVWNNQPEQRRTSTSGGVFAALAEGVLESGGVVFGAAMDEALHLRHVAVEQREELPRLFGAKYVQSEIGDAYRRVRLFLDEGRLVLFSGTPCQVDGLYHFLGEHPEKLLTCDVLCSGVPSPGVWENMVRSVAYIKQKEPVAVVFRDKSYGWKTPHNIMTFQDGTSYCVPLSKSEYGRGLGQRLFLRPACHNCQYASTDRPADLSLGDFSNLPEAFYPDEQKRGITLLLINSEKGAHAFDLLSLKKEKRTLAEAMENPALQKHAPASEKRAIFFNAYAEQPFQAVRSQFLASTLLPRATDKSKKAFDLGRIFRRRGK